MQKVEGSSPFIRLKKSRKCGPFVYRIDGSRPNVSVLCPLQPAKEVIVNSYRESIGMGAA